MDVDPPPPPQPPPQHATVEGRNLRPRSDGQVQPIPPDPDRDCPMPPVPTAGIPAGAQPATTPAAVAPLTTAQGVDLPIGRQFPAPAIRADTAPAQPALGSGDGDHGTGNTLATPAHAIAGRQAHPIAAESPPRVGGRWSSPPAAAKRPPPPRPPGQDDAENHSPSRAPPTGGMSSPQRRDGGTSIPKPPDTGTRRPPTPPPPVPAAAIAETKQGLTKPASPFAPTGFTAPQQEGRLTAIAARPATAGTVTGGQSDLPPNTRPATAGGSTRTPQQPEQTLNPPHALPPHQTGGQTDRRTVTETVQEYRASVGPPFRGEPAWVHAAGHS